jgi:hypothetical protein
VVEDSLGNIIGYKCGTHIDVVGTTFECCKEGGCHKKGFSDDDRRQKMCNAIYKICAGFMWGLYGINYA